MRRLSVTNALGIVADCAVGLAAFRVASPFAVFATWTLTLILLFVGLLGSMVRPGRAAWKGFALFGWGYYILTLIQFHIGTPYTYLPTIWLSDVGFASLHPVPSTPAYPFPAQPSGPTNFNNGLYWPSGNNILTPLNAAEARTWTAYMDELTARQMTIQGMAITESRARQICHAELTMFFALLGSIAGRALDGRPRVSDIPT